MKEDISKILIKWGMPTRQAAIGEMIGYFKKLFGGCEICYGKGYSTQIVQYSEGDGSKKWSEQEPMFCKCNRGESLKRVFNQEMLRANRRGANLLFHAIDREYHNFVIDEAIGKILINLIYE
jgi:hypothetical protein